jgi:hypothetical protein
MSTCPPAAKKSNHNIPTGLFRGVFHQAIGLWTVVLGSLRACQLTDVEAAPASHHLAEFRRWTTSRYGGVVCEDLRWALRYSWCVIWQFCGDVSRRPLLERGVRRQR